MSLELEGLISEGEPYKRLFMVFWGLIETFRLDDQNYYEYEIWFKVFSRIRKL